MKSSLEKCKKSSDMKRFLRSKIKGSQMKILKLKHHNLECNKL